MNGRVTKKKEDEWYRCFRYDALVLQKLVIRILSQATFHLILNVIDQYLKGSTRRKKD